MKKTFLTILIIHYLNCDLNFNSYRLNPQDILRISISDIISTEDDLTLLDYKASENLNVIIPNTYSKIDIENSNHDQFKDINSEKYLDSSYSNSSAVMLFKGDSDDSNQILIQSLSQQQQKLKISTDIIKNETSPQICSKITLEQNKAYSFCYSFDKQTIGIYITDINNGSSVFNNFTKSFEGEYEVENAQMKSFNGKDGTSIILVYFKNSQIPYNQQHVSFFNENYYGNYKIGQEGWQIQEIFLLEHNLLEQKHGFIIQVKEEQDTLYFSEIEGSILKKQEKIFELDQILSFVVFGGELFILEQEDNIISIFKYDFNTKERIQFVEIQDLNFVNKMVGENIFVLHFQNDENDFFYTYSILSQRFSHFSLKKSESIYSLLNIYQEDYLAQFDIKTQQSDLYRLNVFSSVDITSKNFSVSKLQTVSFTLNNENIGGIEIDFLNDKEIKEESEEITLNNNKPLFKHFQRNSFVNYSEKLFWNDINKIKPLCFLEDQSCLQECSHELLITHRNNLISYCKENTIKIFEQQYDIFTQKFYLELKQTININIEKNIDSMKIYFDEILVIKTNEDQFYQKNLTNEEDFEQIDLKQKNLQNCNWNNQGLICKVNNQIAFVEFKFKSGKMVLKEIEYIQGFDKNALYMNSEVDFNYFISLYQNPLSGQYQLRSWKENTQFIIDDIKDLNKETQIFEISFQNYALITKQKDNNYQLKIIKDKSEINYDLPEKISNFQQFLNFPNSSLFAILYKNQDYKLLILDSIFFQEQRGVQLITLNCATQPIIGLDNFNDYIINVFVYCDETKELNVYVIQKQGPLGLFVKSGNFDYVQQKKEIIHKGQIKVNNNVIEDTCKVLNKEIQLQTDELEIDLEKTKNLIIEGECGAVIKSTYLKEIGLKPRLFKQKELVVYNESFYKNTIQAKLSKFEKEQVVIYSNKLVSLQKELKYLDQNQCVQAIKGSKFDVDLESEFFLCRQQFNKNYILTNKSNLEVLIEEDFLQNNTEVKQVNIIQIQDMIYLSVTFGIDNEFMTFIRLSFKEKKMLEVIDSSSISFSGQKLGVSINSFYMGEMNEEIIFLLHSKFSHYIQVIEFSRINIQIIKTHRILLEEKVDIFKVEFFRRQNEFGCFYITTDTIVEVDFVQKMNNWENKQVKVFENKFGLFIADPELRFNQNYLAVLVSRTQNQPHNIYIWQRDNEKQIFTAYKYPNLTSYWIQDFSLSEENDQNLLYILSYKLTQVINDKQINFIYNKIMLSQYRIGNFEAKLQMNGVSYYEGEVFMLKPYSNLEFKFQLQFSKENDFFKFVIFGVLILALFLGLIAIFIFKQKNARMERNLRKDLEERQLRDQIV